MKNQTEITATAIFRIIGQPCWGVPSDDAARTLPYKVCFDEATCNWTCECESGQWRAKSGLSANCKHVRAVMLSVLANKEVQVEPAKPVQAVPLAERGTLRKEVKMVAGIPMR